jgi:hypothetical protein
MFGVERAYRCHIPPLPSRDNQKPECMRVSGSRDESGRIHWFSNADKVIGHPQLLRSDREKD